MKVYVLVIQNDCGVNVQVFSREELAEEAAFQYVKKWWPPKEQRNKELPSSRVEALVEYFGSADSDELCSIEDKEIIND